MYLNDRDWRALQLCQLGLIPWGTITPEVRQPRITATEVINIIHCRRHQLMYQWKWPLILSTAEQFNTSYSNYNWNLQKVLLKISYYTNYLVIVQRNEFQLSPHSHPVPKEQLAGNYMNLLISTYDYFWFVTKNANQGSIVFVYI